jgi:hypothetical protein
MSSEQAEFDAKRHELAAAIEKQGDIVRKLKESGADAEAVQTAVAELRRLKEEEKALVCVFVFYVLCFVVCD